MSQIDQLVSTLIEDDTNTDFSIVEARRNDFSGKDVFTLSTPAILLRYVRMNILYVQGSVTRDTHHYVHENTTSFDIQGDFDWPDSYSQEERDRIDDVVGKALDAIEEDVTGEMRQWNKQIYQELEKSYDWSQSEDVVVDSIRVNKYTFDEYGNLGGDLTYDQLDDQGKAAAREWWCQCENETGDTFWSESVIAEWKWLLKNKGFDGVKIAFSGFSSQGDGASFTAESFDLARYIKGPDPLKFPEKDREQLNEAANYVNVKEIGTPWPRQHWYYRLSGFPDRKVIYYYVLDKAEQRTLHNPCVGEQVFWGQFPKQLSL